MLFSISLLSLIHCCLNIVDQSQKKPRKKNFINIKKGEQIFICLAGASIHLDNYRSYILIE